MNKNFFLSKVISDISSDKINLADTAIVILKPDFPTIEKDIFLDYCTSNNLNILSAKKMTLKIDHIFSVYYDLFKKNDQDKKFGVSLKTQVINYLISGKSEIYFIKGDQAYSLLKQYKLNIRSKYSKITKPSQKVSNKIFTEKVVKNLIHVTDTDELVPTAWSLFYQYGK